MKRQLKWDLRFIEMAKIVSAWSKDPTTKVGAVIVRPDRTVAGIGYNGFPDGIADTKARLNDREYKWQVVIHAEENALLNLRERVDGCTVYTTPICPCPRCASKLIQSGIVRVVASFNKRTNAAGMDLKITRSMLREAGVELSEL